MRPLSGVEGTWSLSPTGAGPTVNMQIHAN